MLTGATVLHGRGPECRMIDELLADLRAGAGGGLLFTGDPGIGKTALLEYAAARTGSTGVLTVRGVEAERGLRYAGLHALLSPVRHLLCALPEHQSEALGAVLGSRPGTAPDPYVVAAATLDLVAAAGDGRRQLLLADDLHLVDEESREVLLFVARRAAGAGMAVIATMDAAPDGHRLEPLSDAAAATVLAASGPAPPTGPVLDALLAVCDGLPVALVEAPSMLDPAEWAGLVPLPDPLPVGPRAQDAVRRGAAHLTAPQWRVLLTVAAGDAGLLAVRAALEQTGVPAAELDEVETAGVVCCHGNEVTFRSPLVRCAAYQHGDVALRRRVHAALASVTTGARRARHLGIATLGVNETVADELERTARQPHASLRMSDAARLLERAADLTADGTARARRGAAAAECWQLAGYAGRAHRIGEQTAQHQDDLCVRADVQALLARTDRIRARPELARRTLRREAVRLYGLDPPRAAAMLLAAADAEALAGEPRAALSLVAQAALLRCGDTGPPPEVIAGRRAAAMAATDRPAPALELWSTHRAALDRILASGALPVGWLGDLWLWYPALLLRLGRLGEAARLLDELVFQARDRRIDGLLAGLLAIRAELHLRTGAWADAENGATESARRAARFGQSAYQASALLCQARLAAARGQRPECAEVLAQARRLVDGYRLGSLAVPMAATEGLLALSAGDHDEAYARLENTARLAEACGSGDLTRLGWLGDYAEAAVRVGRTADVRRRVAEVAPHGTGSLALTAVLDRCAGLLSADEERLRAAGETPEPFEAARAELLLGESLATRGQRDEALGPLRRARNTFDRLAAAPWANRALRALDTVPADPPPAGVPAGPALGVRLAGLTVQEQRVSDLVGRGATNRETAERLFLSPKTVEFHLRSIYRKLGLRSRAELAHIVGGGR